MEERSDRWRQITPSEFSWEREALAFLRAGLPNCEPYRVWANFEFIADDGSIYEADALVLTPAGFWFVEIKSWPGPVTGDGHTWTWHPPDGRRVRRYDNPMRLANAKSKKLKSLLGRQRALKGFELPFLQARIFLSHEQVQPNLDALGRQNVCVRDRPGGAEGAEGVLGTAQAGAYPGIVATLKGTAAASVQGFGRRGWRQVDAPLAKAISRAMDQAGIKPSNRSRRVGTDWLLGDLLGEGPGWQDFLAKHQGYKDKDVLARVRVFGVGQPGVTPPRETLARAARREYDALRNLPPHPAILRPEHCTDSEQGPAQVFPHDPDAVRLDHFLEAEDERLSVDQRLTLLRRLAEAVAWAHERQLVHRALGPQSVLVRDDPDGTLHVQVINWQTLAHQQDPSSSRTRSGTSHFDALVEEPALVYMAPEAHAGTGATTPAADVFSLGAIAYRLFARRAPAADLVDLSERLRTGPGLQLAAAVDGVVPSLVELIALSTNPSVSDRYEAARDFLDHLDKVEEELTTPEPEATVEPLQATKGDRLAGGFLVEKVLGTGSTAIAFRVARDGLSQVLKLALSPEQNERLREEADVLQQVRHKRVVGLAGTVEVGERFGLLLDSADSVTLRERLRRDGRLTRELLQRFGEDLLEAIDYLDQNGFAHRDVKPDNLAVSPDRSSKALRLVLFDFSLARAPRENTRVGTPGYLDPFLPERRSWDGYAERWAAAITLYEMAANTLPRWGDGRSDPASIPDEATIESDLFEASVRAGLTRFFARALRRQAKERYDNALDMRRAWEQVFKDADHANDGIAGGPAGTADTFDEEAFVRALPGVGPDSPLTTLPFGLRVQEALERLGAATVHDLLAIPGDKLVILRGLAHRARRELLAAKGLLAEAVPTAEPPPPPPPPPPPRARGAKAGPAEPVALLAVDALAAQLVPERAGRQGRPAGDSTRAAQLLWLGLEVAGDSAAGPSDARGSDDGAQAYRRDGGAWDDGGAARSERWRSLEDVGRRAKLPRAPAARAIERALRRWSKSRALSEVRQELADLLAELGVATTHELAQALLARRGSGAAEPRRSREARALLRAALEAEQLDDAPRWAFRRAGEVVLVAAEQDDPGQAQASLDYLEQLGREADRLAEAEPLPAPQRVEAALRLLAAPPGLQPLPAERLVRLAAASSTRAAASSRLELYPRGLGAARALQLAAGAIAGVAELSADDLRRRVALRYPAAEPLPAETGPLDQVIAAAGIDLSWSPERDRYLQRTLITLGLSSQTRSGPPRLATARPGLGAPPQAELSPEEADARLLEERLARSASDGGFLVLQAAPHQLERAARELLRFGPRRVSVEERLLAHLHAVCVRRGVAWERVIESDAGGPEGQHWSRLTTLVRQASDELLAELVASPDRLLLTEAGVLARYGRTDLLGRLRAAIDGRTAQSDAALVGVWVVVPDDGQHEGPVLDGEPIPVIGRAQWARLSEAWLANVHRAPSAPAPPERRGPG